MAQLTRHIDDGADDWWYEDELEYFVSEAKTRGIEIDMEPDRVTKDKKQLYRPAISFSGFYSQGDGLAFDADINWPVFFEANPSFKTEETAWYLLLVSNPSYVTGGVERTGRNSNCFTGNLECDYPDVVEHGYFAGVDMESSVDGMPEFYLKTLEDYVLDVCQDEATQMYRSLENSYEEECRYQKDQRIEMILEENEELLACAMAELLLEGDVFDTRTVYLEAEGVDFEDLENLGLIKRGRGSIHLVTDKGKELVCSSSEAGICSTERSI